MLTLRGLNQKYGPLTYQDEFSRDVRIKKV